MTNQLMLGNTGKSAAAVHRRLTILGIDVPAAELREDRIGPGTEAAIRRLQADKGLPVTGVVDDATAVALGLAGAHPSEIRGIVSRPDGTAVAGVTARLCQRSLGGEKVVAESRTGSDGAFSFVWPDAVSAGLLVRVEGGDGKPVPATGAPLSGAAWVRLTIGGEYRGATRFAMLKSAILPRLDGVPVHGVAAEGRTHEVALVAEAAGVPAPEVTRLVLAHKLEAATKVDAAVFFALFEQRAAPAVTAALDVVGALPAIDDAQVAHVLDLLLQLRADNVQNALKAAISDNTIAGVEVDAAAGQLHDLRIEAIAQRPFRIGKTPFRDVLSTTITDKTAQRRVFEAYAAHGTTPAFWDELSKTEGFTKEKVADVRFTLRTSVLLRNHLPLLTRIQTMKAEKKVASSSDLARLDEAAWAALLRETDPKGEHLTFTANLKFKTVDERIEQFASMLASQFERRHPTAAFAGRLAKHQNDLKLEAAAGVQRFLDTNRTFSLRRTHIDRFLKDASQAALAGVERADEVVSELKKIQRVYKLTPRFAHAKAMLAGGYTSAQAIYATGRTSFVTALTAAGATRTAARTIFARAAQAHATTLALLGTYSSALNSVTPSAVAQPLSAGKLQPMLASFPNLQSLFGANDYCSCEHCRSVHGPAAYLVDILQFLKARSATPSGTARDVLLARRPDLGMIELTCENSNRTLPYVDLVCEILEDAVSAPTDSNPVRARQTSASPEELRANPQFVNDAAYAVLKAAEFPHRGPFDLWAAEVRAFLDKLGVTWHELMAAFQIPAQGSTDASPTNAAIAGERLGFNGSALALIANESPDPPSAQWGLTATGNSVPDPRNPDDPGAVVTGTWEEVLAFVPILLHRADLRHRELVQLLATRFINPNGAITIAETGVDGYASCDTGRQAVVGWNPAALTRLSRFLRLWRGLRCPIWDLDKVLVSTAVANNSTSYTAVTQLARFTQIASRLGVPWDELLGFWTDIDVHSYRNVLDESEPVVKSVYARRFRNATVIQTSASFPEDPTRMDDTLDAAAPGIAAALNLSAADIQRIRTRAGIAGSGEALTLAKLSVLFRWAVLASALRISVAELIVAVDVTGANPFTSPATTLDFLRGFDQVRASGFTLFELSYLLRHGSALESGIALGDQPLAGWLDDLRKGMVRVGTAGAPAFVARRISDLLPLDPLLTDRALGFTLPGGTTTIAALFADAKLTQRNGDGSFTFISDRANFGLVFDALIALDKMRIVLSRWRVSTRDASWLLQRASGVAWLQLQTLPASASGTAITLSKLDILRQNVQLQQALVGPGEVRFFDVVMRRAESRDTVAAALAALGGWASADVLTIAKRFGWNTGASLVANATGPRIRDLLGWVGKLGTDVAGTLTFVTTDVGAAQARRARQLAKARYDLSTWYAVAGAVQDTLREQKRAALVAYLLAKPDATRAQTWSNLEQLYGFYLIDPEMSPTAVTTRIKQAAASVQLFVQRCFLQREPSVSVDGGDWNQWEWMKRFRLWEANRKIFLYPENWIDPSQRRHKSPFFGELENELQQSDLGQAAAEDALLSYLHKLAEVSNLEIVGMCDQYESGSTLLHVVARTRKAPHVYYHRRRGLTGVWGAWEKIDADIDAEHVMPVFWNRRLHVFWLEFTAKALPSSSNDRAVPTGGGGTSAEPTKYWEIQLAWTEKRRGRWMPKRLSARRQLSRQSHTREYVFKAPTSGRHLTIDLYRHYSGTPYHDAQWRMSSGDDEPVLLHYFLGNLASVDDARHIGALGGDQSKPALISSQSLDWDHNGQSSGTPGAVVSLSLLEGYPQQDLIVLRRIAQPTLMVEHQDPQFASQSAFFLSDPKRTFLVTPSFVSTTTQSRQAPSGQETYTTRYTPTAFYHPFVDTFMQELNFGGVNALYNRQLQIEPQVYRGSTFDFATEYQPTDAILQRPAPGAPYPVEDVDYSHRGAYAQYNWELFFHVPMLIAKRLADNQRFDEALRWFHHIFNPTVTSGGGAPQRYWIPKVFHELTAQDYAEQQIERLLQLISEGDSDLADKVREWRNDPFDPHLIAASRPVAYQKAIVMQYVATLIAWADQLFRLDTIESINEATQLYLMASELLGPRPQNLRAQQPRVAKTYDELAPSLDAFSNALVDIENVISIPPVTGPPNDTPLPQLHTFYFCVPPNEKLLGYWDMVSDRLFKIRHSLDIDGVARTLALYEPPIDPGLLVRARAAGIDVSTALADLDVDRPHYRFAVVWQRAYELCQDVRSLGSEILSALEKRDAEHLSRVRATQEVTLLQSLRAVKASQLAEAKANRGALERARDGAVVRRDYYASRDFMNPAEIVALAMNGYALSVEAAATISDMFASVAHALPSASFGGAGFGGSPLVTATTGGQAIGNAAESAARVLRGVASVLNQGAGLAGTVGSYQRRRDDWDLQKRTAAKEIEQIDRQLIAADIRIAMCQQELDAHLLQIDDSRTVSEMLESKFTNRELYDWLLSQLSTTYFQAYQLAYDLAKRASKAYAFELGTSDPGYIQFGYWDSLRKGLNAGDKLLLDLRRLQAEHMNRNRRELELTKHVSLAQIDPTALVQLRQTGECFINLPESLFDLDQPGHYMRRLKSVSVTLPCVTGPYTGVNATLTLLTHATRRSEVPGGSYLPAVDSHGIPLETDTRFSRSSGAVQSVALSTGRDDAGLFEVNFHDERYLPFEGAGAISHWRLELPRDTNRFDVSTLSDAVMHLRYTARDGGQTLRTAAREAVIAALPRTGSRLLSVRDTFASAWSRLWAPTGAGQRLDLDLGEEHFPYVAPNHQLTISAVSAFLLFTADRTYLDYQSAGQGQQLKVRMGFTTPDGVPPATSRAFAPSANLGQLPTATHETLAGNVGPLSLAFLEADIAATPLLDQLVTDPDGVAYHRLDRDRIDDILLLVSYKLEARA